MSSGTIKHGARSGLNIVNKPENRPKDELTYFQQLLAKTKFKF